MRDRRQDTALIHPALTPCGIGESDQVRIMKANACPGHSAGAVVFLFLSSSFQAEPCLFPLRGFFL